MKKTIAILLLLLTGITYSYTYDDYELFLKGKNAYESGKYVQAKDYFEQFMRTYRNSLLIKNNYSYYYIGSTYYKLGDLDKASYYLERAVYTYTTPIFSRATIDEKEGFYMMRDLTLGEVFLKMGNEEKAVTYLRRIDYGAAAVASKEVEMKALSLIKKPGNIYDKYYKLKFQKDLSMVQYFSIKQLLNVGKYYSSMGEFGLAADFYNRILSTKKLGIDDQVQIETAMLAGYLRAREYTKLMRLEQSIGDRTIKDHYRYYAGRAYQHQGEYAKAVETLDKIKSGKYYDPARLQAASIAYTKKKYEYVIKLCEKFTNRSFFTDMMLIDSYMKAGYKKEFKKSAKEFIQKYPSIYYAMVFSYYLDVPKSDLEEHGSINKMNVVLDHMISKLQGSHGGVLRESKKAEKDMLVLAGSYGEEELIKMEIENSSFVDSRTIENGYAITSLLEEGKYYKLAYRNSDYYRNEFFRYSDLIKLEFPKYYKDIVEAKAREYRLEPEIIYTLMRNISRFNTEYASDLSRVGLTAIDYTDKSISSKYKLNQLYDPRISIDITCKRLRTLLDKHNNNSIKSIISYVKGEEFLKNLNFNKNDDFDIDTITDSIERMQVQNLIIAYMMYFKLYK